MSEITINPEHRMTKAEAESHQKAIFENIEDCGMRLYKIELEHGWEALGYSSFRDYALYLNEVGGSIAKLYRLRDQAKVNFSLSAALGRVVRLPANHALALKDLEPAQQIEAFKKVTGTWKKGEPKPTEKDFKKAAQKLAPKEPAKKKKAEAGWTKEELEKDTELADHFVMIEAVYGKEDTKAIRDGTVPMKRADVLFLGKMPKENMQKIQDLIFTTSWTPKQCVEFINTEPDDNSTVEDLKFLCLATRGKYWTGEFEGYTVTVKYNRGSKRP
jgi:hypothetical protein